MVSTLYSQIIHQFLNSPDRKSLPLHLPLTLNSESLKTVFDNTLLPLFMSLEIRHSTVYFVSITTGDTPVTHTMKRASVGT